MQHEKSVIAQIGVRDLDHRLLTSVFKLSPDLNNIYEHPRKDEKRIPNVLFVDADDSAALQKWHEIHAENRSIIAIMVTQAAHKIEGFITLKRPVVFKNVLRALIAINSITFTKKTG